MFWDKRKLNAEQSGVTIVELMIVIAVAALIIVLVLVAAPALQRNARNTQRRNDIGAIRGQLTTVFTNNNNEYPDLNVFASDVLAQVEQAIYKGDAGGSVVGAATCIGNDATSPGNYTTAAALADQTGCTAAVTAPDTAAMWTGSTSTPSLPSETAENKIYYIVDRKLDGMMATAPADVDTDIENYVLPGADELHIIVGVKCERSPFANGTSGIGQMGAMHQYTAADIETSTLKTVSFVYQLEGETKARCEDNA